MKRFQVISILFALLFTSVSFGRKSKPAQLPSGPEGPGEFGAYYAHLKYSPKWDEVWRVGPDADVVVRFEGGGHRFVFWRGTSYIPCWVTDNGIWYTNEFVERRGHHSPNTEGCVEPMSDKQCRFSHVRIIENNDARVVVHWRYAPVDVGYNHPFIDPQTGWGDWVDEYYTIYPDAVGVRKITAHTTRPDLWMEWQEAIVLHQPGRRPEDNIELGAVSVANMQGQNKTYYWTERGAPSFGEPKNANIQRINLRAKVVPFTVVSPPIEEGSLITPYGGHAPGCKFQWWNHWPVSQTASDGTTATSAQKPSCSSLSHIALSEPKLWKDYAHGDKWRTKIMLHGMTDKPVEQLVPLARSWLNPAELKILDGDAKSHGYDRTQMAYVLKADESEHIKIRLEASEENPLINPAFVIIGWGDSKVEVKMNGEKLEAGKDYRAGVRKTLHSVNLIIWLNEKSTGTVEIEVKSA